MCAPVVSLRHRQHTERHMHALYYLFQAYIQTDLTERGTWNEEQPWFRAAGSQVHPFCIIRQRPASCCEVILPWKWIKSEVLWLFSKISGICGGIALRFHLRHPPLRLFSDQNQIKPKQCDETYMNKLNTYHKLWYCDAVCSNSGGENPFTIHYFTHHLIVLFQLLKMHIWCLNI